MIPEENKDREKVREWIRGKMRLGEISQEPETTTGIRAEHTTGHARPAFEQMHASARMSSELVKAGQDAVQEDEFFGDDGVEMESSGSYENNSDNGSDAG
jgi:hypothetical protein